MTRQRYPMRRRRPFRPLARATLGVALVALAMGLFAPPALASPESDAADAITAAWTEAGAENSQLGPKDGDVYPVGNGFAQNFAGGAVFYSPDTGARMMYGAILDKYRELGGPADSDLGFPEIDEGAGLVGPDSRNVIFSAGDNPVIFWTPDTGAWVVRGPINAAWDQLGGSAGVLGVPVAAETYDGDAMSQQFSGGEVTYNDATGEFTTDPPGLADQLTGLQIPSDPVSEINRAYRASGGAGGPLGAREGAPYPVGDNGTAQNFAGGKIFYTPDTGASVLSGDILAKYEALGGPTGDFGFPATGEQDGGAPNSRIVTFTGPGEPVIFWTPDERAVAVRGSMKAAWEKLGGATGELGVPVSDQTVDGDVVTQRFGGGQLSWNSKTNTFTSDPASLAESLNDVQVPAGSTPTAEAPAGGDEGGGGLRWQAWWLWWIVPLAVLVVASLVAWGFMRRRRGGRADYDGPDYDGPDYGGPDYDQADYNNPDFGADDDYLDYGVREGVREGTPEREPEGEDGRWSAAGDDRTRLEDREADEVGFLASRGRWAETAGLAEAGEVAESEESDEDWAASTAFIPGAAAEPGELFTHHGAHEAADHDEYEDENPDDVDTAPTLIPAEEAEPSGRHAAAAAAAPSGWAEEPGWDDEDDYLPGPQSLFTPVQGAAPPPEGREDIAEEQAVEDYHAEGAAFPRPEHGSQPAHLAEEYEEYEEYEASEPGFGQEQAPAIHLPLDDPDEAPAGYPVKGSMRTGTYHTPGSTSYESATAEIWFASAELAEANGFTRAH